MIHYLLVRYFNLSFLLDLVHCESHQSVKALAKNRCISSLSPIYAQLYILADELQYEISTMNVLNVCIYHVPIFGCVSFEHCLSFCSGLDFDYTDQYILTNIHRQRRPDPIVLGPAIRFFFLILLCGVVFCFQVASISTFTLT